jgi:hypothetical protein
VELLRLLWALVLSILIHPLTIALLLSSIGWMDIQQGRFVLAWILWVLSGINIHLWVVETDRRKAVVTSEH